MAVSDFSRLLAKEQAARSDGALPSSTSDDIESLPKVPTECLLYGYASKNSEWKVISRYERIVSPSIICEDYDREDPSLTYSTNSPMAFNRSNIVLRDTLSKEALAKSRVYRGGKHWIKVTFDSSEAADRACAYSPVEIDGCQVHCEIWSGSGPMTDAPIPKGLASGAGDLLRPATVGAARGKASALQGFEQAMGGSTLPRSHTMPDAQYSKPRGTRDDLDAESSPTVSSATATDIRPSDLGSAVRSRSVPHLPSEVSAGPSSQFMSRAPAVKKAVLRPISEALPPQQSSLERFLRFLPLVNRILGFQPALRKDEKGLEKGGLIGEGPVLKEDGTWDNSSNGWYWSFWHWVDGTCGSDFCGLKED